MSLAVNGWTGNMPANPGEIYPNYRGAVVRSTQIVTAVTTTAPP
jgi:hypothetical protein